MIDQNPLSAWLAGLAANLQTVSPEDEANKTELFKQLVTSVSLQHDFSQTKPASFSFEKIAPAALTELSPQMQQQLSDVITGSDIASLQSRYKVFQRETPVRSLLAKRSMPSWAAGAAVEKTIGPFINIDGRRFWFDFFKVEKLVALYLNGAANPAILFNIDVFRFWKDEKTALLAPATLHYDLTNDSSIWINSALLAPNAPTGKYTGLTIQSGTIDLTVMPVISGTKTTLPAGTHVSVKLKLKQQVATDADLASPYGEDARVAKFLLPGSLEFEFTGAGSKINQIDDAEWTLFDQDCSFKWKNTLGVYNADLFSLFIPFSSSVPEFVVNNSRSPFAQIAGTAKIIESFWNLPTADLDLTHISPAAGIGALALLCDKGVTITWSGLQNGDINLNIFVIIAHPEGIAIGSTVAGNFYSRQHFDMWQDEKNPHASKVKIDFGRQFSLQFFSTVNGYEIIEAAVNAVVEADRPIDVAAKPLPVHTKASVFALVAFEKHRSIILYDNNLLQDNFVPPVAGQPFELVTNALALQNALFTTTPVTGCFLTGELTLDWKKIVKGNLYLSLGIYKYIPMLPDPYAANVSVFQQFKDYRINDNFRFHTPVMILLCQTKWGVRGEALPDDVDTSFHLLPVMQDQNANQYNAIATPRQGTNFQQGNIVDVEHGMAAGFQRGGPVDWTPFIDNYFQDEFALLDVSSHANQMGVSFGQYGGRQQSTSLFRAFGVETEGDQLQSLYSIPFKIEQVQMMSPSLFVRSFTLPQFAWEPVNNLTVPHVPGDPPKGMNFYPNDGGPTRFANNSSQYVPLAPKPVIKDILERYKEDKKNLTISYFTLPFGLKALAVMSKHNQGLVHPPSIENNRPIFENNIRGGIQVQCNAGKLDTDEYPMFNGTTYQVTNIIDKNGSATTANTLGESVADIFNREFTIKLPLKTSRGVPLTRIDFSGYGASMFSEWANPAAQIAQTSQVKFDAFVGRTAHEVIQVRSIVYPWGIHVVRTIILYRTNTGYVYRVDTGWQPESDGLLNFTYYIKTNPDPNVHTTEPQESGYKIHPGVIRALYNIKNIVEINTPHFNTNTTIKNNQWYLDPNNKPVKNAAAAFTLPASLQKITFDADVEIDGVVLGGILQPNKTQRAPSKEIVGYVQLAPMGVPLSADAFTALILHENGSIGGPLNCVIDINASKQRMRLNRFDISNENNTNANEVFIAAARGSVILPKDGSWSMVTHQASSGEVSPLPENITAPLIRMGVLVLNKANGTVSPDKDPLTQLLRIANPTEISKAADLNTINYGFLQNTGTQKTLFLTPSFQNKVEHMLSKTPPLFADAYHVINSKGIFPNIGDAVTTFKDAHPLDAGNFSPGTIADAGKTVLQLMKISDSVGDAAAFKLAKKLPDFKLPTGPLKLLDEDFLKVYIEYSPADKLGFDIDSLAANDADKWKSRMNNIAMVVDLGDLKRLVTIRGDFNAKKGSESNFGGAAEPTDIAAKLEFSKAMETVIAILQILQDLSGGDYKEAMKKGLQVAMSNNAGTWEYKFSAVKEIPLVKFPLGILYNDPEVPLKLEASLRVGVYFNSALMVTTDAKKLLPTVGAFLGFYGQVTVMCVSLAAATVYAVGQVTLDIAADTAIGPSLHMKFGFGVQLVVGLPVVGNVSVLYMAGVEIYKDKNKLAVSAFLLFKGHAELLAGLVGITITIEAKGTVERIDTPTEKRTNCIVQVSFAIDISIFLVINIDFSTSWEEQRQIA